VSGGSGSGLCATSGWAMQDVRADAF
jgi:hypothetical protein